MKRMPRTKTGLQLVLIGLLPKDGTPVTVHRLANVTGVSEYMVTSALFEPYLAHEVDFDLQLDAYSRPTKPAAAAQVLQAAQAMELQQ